MLCEKRQQRVTEQSHISQKVGIAATGTVLAEEYVTSPMISHLNAGPVAANEPQPLRGAVLLGQGAGEVIVGFGGALVGFFDQSGVAQNNQAAGKGEVGPHRFAGEGMQAAGFDSSVAGFGGDKKRVSVSASNFWANLKRRFWLALICHRYSPPFSTVVRDALRWQCSGSPVIILPSKVSRLSSKACAAVCSHRSVPSF